MSEILSFFEGLSMSDPGLDSRLEAGAKRFLVDGDLTEKTQYMMALDQTVQRHRLSEHPIQCLPAPRLNSHSPGPVQGGDTASR